MEAVGLRELRQHASDLVRRAEAGETLLVTVSGRPAAVLAPAPPRGRGYWRRYDEVAHALRDTGLDPEWETDRALIDDELTDPWTRA
jgi:prevent-host-death family protein